jgi:hypothetical protein
MLFGLRCNDHAGIKGVRQWVLQLSGFVLNQMQSESLLTVKDLSTQKQAQFLREQSASEPMNDRLATLEQVRVLM